jgi:hypothetical protein
VAPSRADLNTEAICKARHQVVFTKTGSNVASGSTVVISKTPGFETLPGAPLKNAELGINYCLKTRPKTNVSLLGKFYEF